MFSPVLVCWSVGFSARSRESRCVRTILSPEGPIKFWCGSSLREKSGKIFSLSLTIGEQVLTTTSISQGSVVELQAYLGDWYP